MKEKIKYLRWFDILIITIILFGTAIYSSTINFLTVDNMSISQEITFSKLDNINAISIEIIELIIAFFYLHLRKFDFSQWKYKITLKSTIFSIFLFIIVSLIIDITDLFFYGFKISISSISSYGFIEIFKNIDTPLVLFSLLNGFYEEIFFLGICTCVNKKNQLISLIYSIFIRISFHTYQGLIPSFQIGLILGIIFYIFYKKNKNLYPFILSHSIADTIGLGIIQLL